MLRYLLLSVVALANEVYAEPIQLMTFNIRYGTANDGENNWEFRKEHVVDTIQDAAPWAIAIQEALLDQLQYIEEHLPGYKIIGVHRGGATEDEFSGLLIDVSKLEILSDGQIWLSETPEEVSKGWDAALPRTATWARVRKTGTTRPAFLIIGTHFDHRGIQARLESANLIVQKANELNKQENLPVAIMGDFNFIPGSEPHNVLTNAGYTAAVSTAGGGTFHGFKGSIDGPRIDFIFLNDKWKTDFVEILRPRRDGKSASDHDPVIALVEPVTPSGTIGMERSIQGAWAPSTPPFIEQWIPEELLAGVEQVMLLIESRLVTEPDYHELSHVVGAFEHPLALPELAGSLTDRLKVLHCEPSNVQALAARVLDAPPPSNETIELYDQHPTAKQVLEFLSIPDGTFYIYPKQLQSALEVIHYSRQIDFGALVSTIQIPTTEEQPFFGKAMPPGVTGSILAGQMGEDGWRVVGGDGPNTYDMTRIAEVFDFGGDDTYFADDIVIGNRLVIDLDGDDTYTGTESQGPAAGLFGTWIIDDRGGDDKYGTVGGKFSTGAGAFGVGLIIDREGNDTYMGTQWSIGAAVYGVGIVLDLGEGDDIYLGEFLTIGVGGPRGFGLVFDERGNELYKSDGPKPSEYDLKDTHSAFSQGMGFGYRRYTAGGIGILCDVEGDDMYQAGEFSQGGAYYHALGILHDFSGNDTYQGNRYAQGFGVHQAFGVLVDDSGDDTYWAKTAANQGAAWDISAGALLDRGGNDSYTADGLAQGSAAQHAIAYLLDLDGADSYVAKTPAQGESGSNRYHWDSTKTFSFSMLLDLGSYEDFYSLDRTNNTTEMMQVNPKPKGRGVGLFIDR